MAAQLRLRGELTHEQPRKAIAVGLAQAREERAAFTGADLVHLIGHHLPNHDLGRDSDHAWQYLEMLTDRAIDRAGTGGRCAA